MGSLNGGASLIVEAIDMAASVTTTSHYKEYRGTPSSIITRLAQEIAEALQKAECGPSTLHCLALIHLAACSLRMAAKEMPDKAPSFQSILGALVHGYNDSVRNDEELSAFNTEFQKIVEAYGGYSMEAKVNKKDEPIFMSPSLGVH